MDVNLQRENILPSERAWAFRMKLEAIKYQGERTDLTFDQVGQKSGWAVNQVADDCNSSKTQVQRYIRLTYLLPQLLDMVDDKKLAFNPAVEISFFITEQQRDVMEAMDYARCLPSLSQAIRIKKLAQTKEYSLETVEEIMNEEKKSELDQWQKKRSRDMNSL